MKPRQQLGPPCSCGECVQAGADQLPSVIDTRTGESALHGYPLKNWHAAKDKFVADFKRAAGIASEARP